MNENPVIKNATELKRYFEATRHPAKKSPRLQKLMTFASAHKDLYPCFAEEMIALWDQEMNTSPG